MEGRIYTRLMRPFIKNILQVTLPTLLVVFLVLEVIFRTFIPATESPNYEFDSIYRVLRYEAKTEGDFTIGAFPKEKFHWTINNSGWNNPTDYAQNAGSKKRIAVIGDSFIESFVTHSGQIFPVILDSLLGPDTEVYSFGISGAPLSHYLHMARYVAKKFNPDMLIINVVHNDYDESIHGYYDKSPFLTINLEKETRQFIEIAPEPYATSRMKKNLKSSALIRYLVANLHLPSLLSGKNGDQNRYSTSFNGNINDKLVHSRKDEIELVLDYLLQRFASEFPEKEILFVADGPRQDIYANTTSKSSIYFLNQILSASCAKYGLPCLDLTAYQDSLYQKNAVTFNSNDDFHWNAYGHRVVAKHIFTYLNQNDGTIKRSLGFY